MKRLLVFVFAVVLLGSCDDSDKEQLKEDSCKTVFIFDQGNEEDVINTKTLLIEKGFEEELLEFENMLATNWYDYTCDELYAKWDDLSGLVLNED